MILCKIMCPSCGTEHDISVDKLKDASCLECVICGNEIQINSKAFPSTNSKRPKTLRNMKMGAHSTKKRTTRKTASKQKRAAKDDKKQILFIFGGAALLILISGFVILAQNKQSELSKYENAKINESEQKDSANQQLKAEMADLKKKLLEVKSSSKKSSATNLEKNSISAEYKNLSNPTSSELSEAEEVISIAPSDSNQATEISYNYSQDSTNSKENTDAEPSSEIPDSSEISTGNTEVSAISKSTILIESEQRELEELMKVPSYELTFEEEDTLKELKAKYAWIKANRFKMTREQLEYEWDRRWTDIAKANAVAKERTDAMLPRPLQILLAEAKSMKDRAYLMRIYQKPISFEEKEKVRKARNQAIWERRKADGPMRYPEDRKKKKEETYTDEYGYEYYLDANGQRVYL